MPEMRLQKLTGLEVNKVVEEYKEIIKLISKLKGILDSKPRRMSIIKQEMEEIRERFGDERRTEILPPRRWVLYVVRGVRFM